MIQDLYNKTMSVYTQSSTQNQIGEAIVVKTLFLSNIKCRMNRLSGKDIIYLDNIATAIDIKVFCDVYTSFDEWDYITIDNIEYRIYSSPIIYDYSSNHHMELLVYVDRRQ